MSNLNVVVLQGNLTRDPETRFSAAGLAIVSFGIAVNGGFGEKEEVSFIDCTAFGKQGEALAKFFNKGKQILVQGRIRQERWEDKTTGGKRSKLSVIVESFNFVSGGKAPTAGEAAPAGEVATAEATAAATPAASDDGKLF
jgi:single-strand DNA-binding protein